MTRFKLNIRLFDGEGAGAATGSEAGGSSVTAGNAAGAVANKGEDAAPRPSFEELIKGDYKADADRYIQGIIRDRVKGANATIKSQGDILSIVAAKYGMDTSDLDALKEKVSNDDAYYEDKAYEEGLTVDQYKRIAQAEAKVKSYENQMQAQRHEQEVNAQIAAWQEQAAQVKEAFPDFDLGTEMQNQTFTRLLQNGVDMQSAYVALHNAEILQGAMQYTASAVRKATANDIASRGARPRENASGSRAAARIGTDVSKMTRAEREALSRRAAAGEIIEL